jgi:hypothetical protein
MIPGEERFFLLEPGEAQRLVLPEDQKGGIMGEMGIMPLMNPLDVFSWSAQTDIVESAAHASMELSCDYDLGVGIAKRGLWLSYMFSRSGMETQDLLVKRFPSGCFTFKIDDFDIDRLRGCRILLFDNDAVTGSSVIAAGEHLQKLLGPERIDLLLIYRYARMYKLFHDQIKDRLVPGQTLGREKGTDRLVVDVMSQIPKSLFRRRMSLEQDFRSRKPLQRRAARIQI